MTCCSELDILFKKQGVFIPRTDRWARNSSGKMTTKNTINYLIEKNFISPLMLFVSLNLAHGNMYLIQHYVIKFVSDLWHISGYLSVLHKYQIDTSSPLWTFNSNVKLYRCTRYNIMWQSLSVTCDGSVVFLRVLRFPPPIKLTATI